MRILVLMTVLLLPLAVAQADDATLVKQLEAFFAEADAEARAGRGMALAMENADAAKVAAAVAKARRWAEAAPADKVVTWTRTSPGDLTHTVFASIPPNYDASKPWPVLIWLHGAVARGMFDALWPAHDIEETPIGHVTNGVHARTWVSGPVDELLRRLLELLVAVRVGPDPLQRPVHERDEQELGQRADHQRKHQRALVLCTSASAKMRWR